MRQAKAFLVVCAGIFLLALAAIGSPGCSKKPTQPALGADKQSLVGAWTGGEISVVVNQNYTWEAFGELRWSCNFNGVPATCSHQLDVTGVVEGGNTYSISGRTTSGSGTTDQVTGSWDADITRLSGTVSTSGRLGGVSKAFSLTKTR